MPAVRTLWSPATMVSMSIDEMCSDAERTQHPHRVWAIGAEPAVAIWAIICGSNDSCTGNRYKG